jgi:hypothetical protein
MVSTPTVRCTRVEVWTGRLWMAEFLDVFVPVCVLWLCGGCMCRYVCVRVCVCINTCGVCMCVHVCLCVCVYVCVCVWVGGVCVWVGGSHSLGGFPLLWSFSLLESFRPTCFCVCLSFCFIGFCWFLSLSC